MYKGTSGSLQTRDRLTIFRDAVRAAGGKDEMLSKRERLEDVQRALANLDYRIVLTPKYTEERRKLGAQKRALADESQRLKAELKFIPKSDMGDFSRRFMDAAKELLPKHLYRMVHEHAKNNVKKLEEVGLCQSSPAE